MRLSSKNHYEVGKKWSLKSQHRHALHLYSLGSEFWVSEKQKVPVSRTAKVSSDVRRRGSGLRYMLVARHRFILCLLLPEGGQKPLVKLLLMETDRQSSCDPSRGSEVDLIRYSKSTLHSPSFQHPLLEFQVEGETK